MSCAGAGAAGRGDGGAYSLKFLCEHCKAKYQIADDKVAGRTVRMKCRKCGGQIEVRAAVTETSVAMKAGDLANAEIATEMNEEPAAKPAAPAGPNRTASSAARPAAPGPRATPLATSLAKPAAKPTPSRPATPAVKESSLAGAFQRNVQRTEEDPAAGINLRELSAADEWYVAVNGVPVGPVRVGEVRRKAATGAVTEESLCWQEGMEEWRAIRTVTELAAVVREAAAGGRTSLIPSEPRPSLAPRPPAPRAAQAPHSPSTKGPAAPAWGKPASGPGPQHRPMDADDDAMPTIVGRSPLLDELLAAQGAAPAALAQRPAVTPTNGAPVAAPFQVQSTDPFAPAAPAPDPFRAPAAPQNGLNHASAPAAFQPAVAAQPYVAPPIVAPAPSRPRLSPIALGMLVMFGCFGLAAAYFLFAAPPRPVAAPVASAAPVAPSAAPVPTDIPAPVAATAATAAPVVPDAGPQKVASNPGRPTTGGSGTTGPKPTGPAAIDVGDLLGGGPKTGPSTAPGAGGGGGGASLTSGDVEQVVTMHSTQLKRTCWERSGSTTPSANERVHIVVAGSGAVQSATATGNDPVVGKCLEDAIRQWHWPGGGEIDVPFHFVRQ